tara:strand:+ start:1948 stop:2190 length:243 start_codon:yes stop_codon:yes gene_type:complete
MSDKKKKRAAKVKKRSSIMMESDIRDKPVKIRLKDGVPTAQGARRTRRHSVKDSSDDVVLYRKGGKVKKTGYNGFDMQPS